MRPGAACLQCRNGKRKCDKPVLGTVCEQCKKRQLPCSSLNRRSSSTTILRPSLHDTRASSNTLPLPSVVDIEQLVELYIRFIHDKPHTLFHEPTLRSAVKNGNLPHTVLFGILGLSARFSDRPEIRSQSHAFSLEAKRLVKADLENVCIETVQACILAGNICLAESNPDSESLFFVIANRMALLLGFSSESSADDCVLRETKRRIWWSLYLIDRWASAGLGLPRQFHIGGSLVPRLPMDEVEFQNMISGGEEANIDWSPGIWAHMISLVQIFGHIQDLNQNLVESDWDEDHIESSVFSLAGQLISFESDLPSTMLCTQENLALQVQRGVGRTFVALHLGYHHYATLLYYQYLDPHRPATPNGRMYAQRCKYHATEFCELIRTSREYGHTEAFHNVVGHMTVVSSSVLLHTLLLGDDEELPMARQRLESNFESLVKLREFWPSVELMMNRLITFQNACLRTAMLGTHRFDKWMVKFLLQHALALDEKGSTSEEGFVDGVLLEDERLRERSRVTENIIRA